MTRASQESWEVGNMLEALRTIANEDQNARRGPKSSRSAGRDANTLMHELNNALTVVNAAASMMQAEMQPDSVFSPDVEDINRHTRLAIELVRELGRQLATR